MGLSNLSEITQREIGSYLLLQSVYFLFMECGSHKYVTIDFPKIAHMFNLFLAQPFWIVLLTCWLQMILFGIFLTTDFLNVNI